MGTAERIVVVGGSGSGKTTVARRLAEVLGWPYLEMDSVAHMHGWADGAHEDFLPALKRFTSGDRWVVDGNYTSWGTREVVWPQADTFVWLDPPRRTAMARVIRRTMRRLLTREELWGAVREPLSNLYSLDPYKNIIVWTWTRSTHVRERYEAALADGVWDHAQVHRLRTKADVARFLETLAAREE
ncbi:MAG: adenylate kinase [Actinomycetota bacterium]